MGLMINGLGGVVLSDVGLDFGSGFCGTSGGVGRSGDDDKDGAVDGDLDGGGGGGGLVGADCGT